MADLTTEITQQQHVGATLALPGVPARVLVLDPAHPRHDEHPVLLDGRELSIGSEPHCDLCLPNRGVGSRHAVIATNGRQIVVRATDRRTWLNGFPISESVLRDGDVLAVGPVEFRIRRARADELVVNPPARSTGPLIERLAGETQPSAKSVPAVPAPAPALTETELGLHQAARLEQASRLAQLADERASLADERARFDLARAQFDVERRELTAARQNLEADRAQFDSVQSQLEAQREQIDFDRQKFANELAAIAAEGDLLDDFDSVSRDQESERRDLETLRAELDAECARLQAVRAELETQRTQGESERRQRDAERSQQHAAQEKFKAELTRLESEHRVVESQKKELQTFRRELEARSTELERERSECESERLQWEADQPNADSAREALDTARIDVETERLELEAYRTELEAGRQELEAERAELELRHTEIETERSLVQSERLELVTEQERLSAERDRLADANARLESRRAELEVRRRKLETESSALETSRTEIESRRAQLNADRAQFEADRISVAAERAEIKTAREKFEAAESEWAGKQSRMQASLDAKSSEMALERSQLAAEKERLAAERDRFTNEEARFESRWAELETRRRELADERSRLEARQAQLERDREQLDRQRLDVLTGPIEPESADPPEPIETISQFDPAALLADRGTEVVAARSSTEPQPEPAEPDFSKFEPARALGTETAPLKKNWANDADRFSRFFRQTRPAAATATASSSTSVAEPDEVPEPAPLASALIGVPAPSAAIPESCPEERLAAEQSEVCQSVADYMQQLLARNPGARSRGEQPAVLQDTVAPAAPERETSVRQTRAPEPIDEAAVVEAAPEKIEQPVALRRKRDVDEIRAGVWTLREVANLSARTAVAAHSSRRLKQAVVLMLPLTIISFVLAGGMLVLGGTEGLYFQSAFSTAVVGAIAGIALIYSLLTARRDRRHAQAAEKAVSVDSSEPLLITTAAEGDAPLPTTTTA